MFQTKRTRTLLRLLLVLALCFAISPGAQAIPEGLFPPIDRKAWMAPSPSRPLKVLKQPAYGANYPLPADYLRVLERFPLYGERGWRANYLGDPSLGFFADPDSAEMGLRSMGNFIFVMALLASDPGYDPAVTGVDRDTVLSRARSCLRYMTRSHVTGDIPCGDGKKWGDHWQSAWWTAKMALGAQLIWDRLSEEERGRVERVVVHEASRHLGRKAPGGALRDTKSEENAWDTEVMAAAVALFPRHPRAGAWRAKMIEFYLNALSAPQDKTSAQVVDGKPLKDQVYTENIRSDFTIENHGAYHFCYMACPLHSVAWGHYALTNAKQPVPEAQFHHFEDVWRRVKPTFWGRGFAYPAGNDWPRYAYGHSFIMPALVVLQDRFGDADARAVEAIRFRAFEQEQLANADGSFFGKRFSRNIMMDRWAEFESDCYANLGVSYLLHKRRGREPARPAGEGELNRRLADRHISVESGLSYVRTPGLFASHAWRMLHWTGPYPTAFFIPRGMENAAEWGEGNLLGRIDVAGVDPALTLTQNLDVPLGQGFQTTGRLVYRKAGASPAYTHEIHMEVRPEEGAALVESRFVADADITVRSIEGLRLHVANDVFNGAERTWISDGGTKTIRFDVDNPHPEEEIITPVAMGRRWINIDNKLGVVQLRDEDAPFILRQSNRRNAWWGSIHFDILDSPALESRPRSLRKGDVILHTRFLLVAGDAKQTEAAAASPRTAGR